MAVYVNNFTIELKMTDLDEFTEAVKLKLNKVIEKIGPSEIGTM